ncbi:MAG: hypothetical protein K6F05_06605 [Succinivibrio sp.]|nr:hypothetical protein [Succinivibrio sp.]
MRQHGLGALVKNRLQLLACLALLPALAQGADDQRPWSQTSLVLPKMVTELEEADRLFDRFMPHRRHPLFWGQTWPMQLEPDKTFSLFPFLMRRGYGKATFYAVPFVSTLREGFDYRLYQNVHQAGRCAGQSLLEGDFKGHCQLPWVHDEPALVLLNTPPETVQKLGSYDYGHYHLPRNGVRPSYAGLLYGLEPRLLGFSSNSDQRGFIGPLSTLDKRLYSRCQSRYVQAGDEFVKLREKCALEKGQEHSDLFFAGSTALIFLGHLSEEHSTPADRLLQVSFTKDHKPVLSVRNALLSDSDFVNYGFYTEAELLVLQDLEYNLNPRDFYGFSIYTSGSKGKLASHLLATGYAAWDDELRNYNYKQYSRVPLGVGAHIYGDYNQVEQLSEIASAGAGAIGVRIDGVGNRYTLNSKYAIYEQGQHASGITVAYGHDNHLNIEGTVAADSSSGVGILCSYGSNLRSDLLEYQGSYHRVRSYDYERGIYGREQAESQLLPEELKGPLVKRMIISGMVRGGKAAISIDRHAHVEEIYLRDKAHLMGDLISRWNPYMVDGEYYVKGSSPELLPARLQLEYRPLYAKEQNFNLLENKLKTKVILGAEDTLRADQLSDSLVGLKVDQDAYIDVDGNIEGLGLNLYSVGGQTHLRGSFNVNLMQINSSVVHLEHRRGKASKTQQLTLSNGGVLDLVNSHPTTVIVDGQTQLDQRAVIHVDINDQGALLDHLWFNGPVSTPDNKIALEPGLNFELLKRFTSDPKSLYTFVRHFMVQANHELRRYGLQVRFPKHIWLDSGDLGREIRCGIHDCHVGQYVAATDTTTQKLSWWRYLISAAGLVFLLLCSYIFMKIRVRLELRDHASKV